MSTRTLCSLAAAGALLVAAIAGVVCRGAVPARPPAETTTQPPQPVPVGINLAPLTYHASEYPFVDVFQLARPFLHQAEGKWSVEEPLSLRPDGYPAELAPGRFAGTLIFRDVEHYPAGDYVCRYEGRGRIEFGFAARVVHREPGRIVVRVTPQKAGIYFRITATDPKDPIHDVRLWLPGFEEAAQPFQPAFLARWRGFSVLRFMDWMRINGSEVAHWGDRNRLAFQTQASDRGVAPELIAALCNELDADAWVCVPHLADDDYVRHLAHLLGTRLEPGRRLWVEYSNETWNATFTQHDYCCRQGMALGLARDPFTAGLRYAAQRAVQIFALFEHQLGGRDLVRVLAAQNANPATSRTMLAWRDAAGHADALAVAPYFGPAAGGMAAAAELDALSVDQLLDRCRPEIDTTLRCAAQHYREAHAHGLALVAYEAGQHMVGYRGAENDEALTALLTAANRHPRMGELYDLYLRGWQQLGGGLLCAFNSTGTYTKWGSWGHAEDYGPGSEQAPKYRALVRFRDAQRGPRAPR